MENIIWVGLIFLFHFSWEYIPKDKSNERKN